MIKYIFNNDTEINTYSGQQINAGDYYEISSLEERVYANDSKLITDIGSGKAIISKSPDISGHIVDVSSAIVFLKNELPMDVSVTDKDGDTNGVKVTTKYAPDGFYQRLHEIEFTTSTVGGAIHDRDMFDVDTGFSSVDFYELIDGVETLMINPTQLDLNLKCIRTDYKFMPTVDYMVMSGVVALQDIPLSEIYMWGVMLDVDPSLNVYGIFPIEVLGGGMAMSFIPPRKAVGLKGVNGTMLYYSGVNTPSGFIALPPGLGTNRIRYIMRHSVGVKHRFQSIFEIFKA